MLLIQEKKEEDGKQKEKEKEKKNKRRWNYSNLAPLSCALALGQGFSRSESEQKFKSKIVEFQIEISQVFSKACFSTNFYALPLASMDICDYMSFFFYQYCGGLALVLFQSFFLIRLGFKWLRFRDFQVFLSCISMC